MQKLADLLFRTVDGVLAVDTKQHIVYWDPACEQLFGISSAEAIGQSCCKIIRGTDPLGHPFCQAGCCANLANGGDGPKIFPLRARDSEGRELKLSVSIVLMPSRKKNQWICVHLLHRGNAVDTLELLEYSSPKNQPARNQNNGNDQHAYNSGSSLTAREQEILQLMAEGLQVPTIAQLLNVSFVTVRNHIQHIESKLGVHSQAETVAYAYRHNLVLS